MDLTDLIKAIKESGKKTQAYDTQATVRRVEGKTAWVHIPGGVDETPVKMTVKAKPGDTVQVRVGGGKAWVTGNATAPPTDDTVAVHVAHNLGITEKVLSKVKSVAESAAKIAGNTDQYFWFTKTGTDTGAHITEVPQEDFLEDPDNGGGNLLARSNGVAIRDGLAELATFGAELVELGKNTLSAQIKMCAGKLSIFANAYGVSLWSNSEYEESDPTTYYSVMDLAATNKNSGGQTHTAEVQLLANASYGQNLYQADRHQIIGDLILNNEGAISDWSTFLKYSAETITDANGASFNSVIRLANSHGVSNVPITNACFLITIGSNASNKVQFCTAANTSTYDLHMRKCSSGSWGSWKKVTFS